MGEIDGRSKSWPARVQTVCICATEKLPHGKNCSNCGVRPRCTDQSPAAKQPAPAGSLPWPHPAQQGTSTVVPAGTWLRLVLTRTRICEEACGSWGRGSPHRGNRTSLCGGRTARGLGTVLVYVKHHTQADGDAHRTAQRRSATHNGSSSPSPPLLSSPLPACLRACPRVDEGGGGLVALPQLRA